MAKTIGQLTQATTLASGDEFVIEQSGLTKRIAASVVRGGLVNADIDAAAAIALSKLATGALPTAITVSAANLVAAVANALVPVGTVQSFARSTAPTGWLAANGNTIGSAASNATNASADYSALFTVLWDNWTNTDLPILDSAGAASTRGANAAADFAANKRLPLPDLRGIFVRGSGSQTISGITYNKTFAAKEGDAFQGHQHDATDGTPGTPMQYSASGRGAGGFSVWFGGTSGTTGHTAPASDGTNGTPRTASETRPANIALLYCIKF
jgi:hypothetical protein